MADRLYAATRKGLFTISKTDGRWAVKRVDFLADHVVVVLPDRRDGSLYAALKHDHFGGKLHRTTDGGQNWQACAVPEYPERPADATDVDPVRQTPIPWKLQLIWGLEPGGADQPGLLWCGTVPGGLFRSPDAGQSWQMIESLWRHPSRAEWFGGGMELPGIHSIVVDPRDSRRVLVGVSCGGVWVTADGGETWNCQATGMRADYMPPEQAHNPNIQDVHRLVACPAAPDHLWVQHHNGVFHSTDGSKTWTDVPNVPPAVFGFAVAVHPADPKTAWFVPAIKDERRIPVDGKVTVARTRDGGQSFESLSAGLPQEHAYDLCYRHSLDVDRSGNVVAFGSTTGSLWLSENQGDSWQTISNHLPPIYCVRFA